jgi:hypothetical protein
MKGRAGVDAVCALVMGSCTGRGSAWLATATIDGVTYSAKSRSCAVAALCRELVAGGVIDGPMTVTFDGVAGQMTIRSIYKFAGTTTTEGDAPLHRVKWHLYQGPQNAQPRDRDEARMAEEEAPVLREGSDNHASVEAPPLSVTDRVCAGCGEVFAPQRSTARFCSTRCRMAVHRRASLLCRPAGGDAAQDVELHAINRHSCGSMSANDPISTRRERAVTG